MVSVNIEPAEKIDLVGAEVRAKIKTRSGTITFHALSDNPKARVPATAAQTIVAACVHLASTYEIHCGEGDALVGSIQAAIESVRKMKAERAA